MRKSLRGLAVTFVLIVSPYKSLSSDADTPRETDWGVNINLLTDIGAGHSSYSQDPNQNFREFFLPPGGTMGTTEHKQEFFWDLGLSVGPSLRFRGWEVDLPVAYSISLLNPGDKDGFKRKKTIASIELDWWDVVDLFETRIEKTSPAFGLGVRKGGYRIQYLAQRYAISQYDFRGRDCKGCENSSEPLSSRIIKRGFGHRIDLMLERHGRDSDDTKKKALVEPQGMTGVFCEIDGSKVFLCGLSFRFGERLPLF